jgi:D-alanine-D-alanine ligase
VRIFANGQVETVIIEVNSLPGMTPATCIYHQAALKDYKPFDFIKEILNFGRTKWQQESKRINSSI